MIRERKIFVSIFHSPLFNFISKIYNINPNMRQYWKLNAWFCVTFSFNPSLFIIFCLLNSGNTDKGGKKPYLYSSIHLCQVTFRFFVSIVVDNSLIPFEVLSKSDQVDLHFRPPNKIATLSCALWRLSRRFAPVEILARGFVHTQKRIMRCITDPRHGVAFALNNYPRYDVVAGYALRSMRLPQVNVPTWPNTRVESVNCSTVFARRHMSRW